MRELIFKGFDTDELVAQLENAPVRKLIRELNHVYGLKVIQIDKDDDLAWKKELEFVLGYESNGLAFCNVWTEKEMILDKNVDKYFFRTPYYRKERGNSTADRETVHSVKLASLMSTLKKQNIVYSADGMMRSLMAQLDTTRKNDFIDSFGNAQKSYHEVDTDTIHLLLSRVIEGKDVEGIQLDVNKCQLALDKYNKSHTIRLDSQNSVKRFYENNFYLVASTGVKGNKHLIVGVLKRRDDDLKTNYNSYNGGGNCTVYDIVEPLKRFTDFNDSHGHIKGLLTMLKVATEGVIDKYDFNFIPVDSNKYFKDLDMFTTVLNRAGNLAHHRLNAVLIPCGENYDARS